ncbi:MAG: DUF4911 domain-containing protein [Desulfocapsaceae bacterium]|jgi:hypothetical protein|nr:DUF4911 domain-containing protein [Desulfocapsaceae bacterium]
MSEINHKYKTSRLPELFLVIDPARFHFLKFILEGYDNLAVLSSTDSRSGIVRLKTTHESYPELLTLLAGIAGQIKKSIF